MTDETLFAAALEKADPAARAAFLAAACPDAEARARVERLLAAHDRAGAFMNRPAVAPEGFPTVTQTSDGGSAEPDDALGVLAPSARPDSLGRIGHYEVLQVLGKGAFGIVFRAFDDVLQRVVAVKVMAPQLAATSPARKRFLREAQSSAQVRHENVVQVYEIGEQPLPFIVMEFIPGETLQQRLNRVGPLDAAEVVGVGRQIAEGLAAAHANDLVHRDIKPGNVLIEGGQGRVKITDFGLARAADDASISQSGIIAGTPMYMAPEQALGQKLDQRADPFSLGSVLYQMAAGRPPFRAAGTVAVLKRVAEDTPRAIREITPETPQWLCDVIAKLHAKNPADRYQTAREVADVLADCERQLKAGSKLKDYSLIPRAARPARRRVRAWVAALALLAPVALVAVALGLPAWQKWQAGAPAPEPAAPAVPAPADGFVALFNGKDLTGWKTHPEQPGGWEVRDGVLVGTGRLQGHLFSDRADFANFHLRAEVKINAGGDGGVRFRAPFKLLRGKEEWQVIPHGGYEAEFTRFPNASAETGSVWRVNQTGAPNALFRTTEVTLTRPDGWHRYEVIADGNRFVTKLDGREVGNCTDPESLYAVGHLALQCFSPRTVVQYRAVEVKELPTSAPAAAFTNGVGMAFVRVPKGKAWLGGGKDRPGETEVVIPADFFLGKYEVTQDEWERVMGANPSSCLGNPKELPVESVSWAACQEFVAKLNDSAKEPGWVYRLPTEAEWEYACRGGPMAARAESAFDYYFSTPTNDVRPGQANFDMDLTKPVGSYQPNSLGLFDMHGNVHEWCDDPRTGADGTPLRVRRGGCWGFDAEHGRASQSDGYPPSEASRHLGLRLARVPVAPPRPKE